jgi:hypothetical protein
MNYETPTYSTIINTWLGKKDRWVDAFFNLSLMCHVSARQTGLSKVQTWQQIYCQAQQNADMQKVENLQPAVFQGNIFRKGAKSNALTRTFEFQPIFWNLPLALLGC